MTEETGLRFGPIREAIHLCVDMQAMFLRDTPWAVEWMERILPKVVELTEAHPERNLFTRFITPRDAGEAAGSWRRYYEKWEGMTRAALPDEKLELVEPLRRLVPPGQVFDKKVYSPWFCGRLHQHLQERGISTVIVSGAETDVCVLAAVMTAIDHGYRTILATDALCGSADETHEALMSVYRARFGLQVETATVAEIVADWSEG